MNRPEDPAFEIRDALDREARRRLDPDRLCATLEEEARSAPAIHGGPLSRVPAAVQWVGIAAAVIAALTGLRSLYVDLASPPEPAPRVVEIAAVEPEPPETAEPIVAAPVEERGTVPPEPAEVAEPLPEIEPPPSAGAQETAPVPAEIVETPAEEPGSTRIGGPSSGVVATAPRPFGQGSTPRRQPPPPGPPAEKPAPKTTTTRQPAPIVAQPGSTVASVTGGVTYGQSSVRVTSFRYGGMNLEAKVSAVPNLGATLVTFGPPTGPTDPADRASGQPRELSSIASTIPAASVDYHLRVLVGSTEDYLIEQRHAWLGAETDVVPLLGNLWFGNDRQKAVLTDLFELRSIVASDNVRIPVEEGFAETNLVASAAGKRYELAVGVTPEKNGSGRQLDLQIVYRPTGELPRQRSRIEASLLVEEGEVVLIALPNRLLERRRVADLSESEMLFVAISTGSAAIDETIRRFEDRIVEEPANPPILIDGPQVDFLNKIAEQAFTDHGTLTLQAMVREDGTVDAIRLLGAPSFERADLLVEFAAAIVRSWRYLPAQDRGRPVATWVEVELEF